MQAYDPAGYPPFAVTADLVVLTVTGDALAALVVRRGERPFAGRLALPGGFVRADEGLDDAARRELAEETGLRAADLGQAHLEQLASYGDPGRDPRMRVVTVAYLVLAPDLPVPVAGGDAAHASFAPVAELLEAPDRLAFDHARVLADGVERARAKLEYTTLATAFCPPIFTVADLRRVYDIVWGTELDPRNFHRKATGTPGFLVPVASSSVAARHGRQGRPAGLFRAGEGRVLYPPILRRPIDFSAP